MNLFGRKRKYSTRPSSGFSISLKKKKDGARAGLRFGTHAQRARRRRIVLAVAGVLLLGALWWLLFRSPYFQIHKIKVMEGDTTFTSENATAILQEWLGQNILTASTADMHAAIEEQYPTISELEISRYLPDQIRISAADFPIGWVLTRVGSGSVGRFLLNTAGYVAGSATSDNAVGLPALELHSNDELTTTTEVMPLDLLARLTQLGKNIESRFGLGVLRYQIFDVARELSVLLENNWQLRLTLDQDWDLALSNLAEALRGQDISELNFEYIDLRVPNKIFFQER